MVQDKRKPTSLWIVLIAALAILLVGWLIFTADGPDPTPGEAETVESGNAPVAEPVQPAAPNAVDVELPEAPVGSDDMEELRAMGTQDGASQ